MKITESYIIKTHIIETHIVPINVSKIRLSDYLSNIFIKNPSRKGIKKAIKQNLVLVNGIIANTAHWVESGQKIELVEAPIKPIKVFEFSLEVVYQDAFIALINKPAGIAVSGNKYRTIQHALPYNLTASLEKDALPFPLPVHRLDVPTNGLLLVAKTKKARIVLGQHLEQRLIQKKYQALVWGGIQERGVFTEKIDNQEAITNFDLVEIIDLQNAEKVSLVNLYPKTGRTHQLRKHLSGAGFPILGDGFYGKNASKFDKKGLMLCAVGLEFVHPILNKKTTAEIDLPKRFQKLL